MSNQVYSNDTSKYPISGSDVTILGLPLTAYLNQPVKTTSNVSFAISTALISSSLISCVSPEFRSVGTSTQSPGTIPTYQLLAPLFGTGIRRRTLSGQQPQIGAGNLNFIFTGLSADVGTVEIATQYVSTAGLFIGQYGVTRQVSRFTNTSGTVVVGATISLSVSRDAGLTPGPAGVITLTGGANTLTVGIGGLAGVTLLISATIDIFQ